MRYSCVIVNIMHTNTILSTGLDANSALLGVTFYVYVNDTSYVCFSLIDSLLLLSFKNSSLTLFFLAVNSCWTQRKAPHRCHSPT